MLWLLVILYAQVYTRPTISLFLGMLGSYLSDRGVDHWKEVKTGFKIYIKKKRLHAYI